METRASITGDLVVGEANAVVRDLQKRTQGPLFGLYFLLFVVAVVFTVGGYLLVNLIRPGESWGAIVGGIAAYLLCMHFGRLFAVNSYRAKFADRGLQLELPMRVDVEPDSLVAEIGGVKRVVQWQVVTELFKSHGYWVILAQGDAIFAPGRLFPSENDERVFVGAVLANMTTEAKARSADALTFVGPH